MAEKEPQDRSTSDQPAMSGPSLLVGVKCACCRSFDKTQILDLVGDFRRLVEIWRCDRCGEPCANRLCNGFQLASFEDGSR